jgi:hypothetical protein
MTMQVILLSALAVLVGYALAQHRRSPLVSFSIMGTCAVGAILVIFPDDANLIAHELGVGRGADLIFYVFILIALSAIFNLHLRLRAASEVSTELARAIALLSARQPPGA